MTCFVENFLHEIPTDIQLKIMDITAEEKKIEQEKIEILYEKIQNEESEDVIYILRRMKDDYDIKDEDEFYDDLHEIVNICCEEEHEEDNYETLKKAVDKFGIFKAMKLGIERYGEEVYDIENTSEIGLYRQCYFHILYDCFTFTYEDIKLIKEYDIECDAV
jgi:hypothetical protein